MVATAPVAICAASATSISGMVTGEDEAVAKEKADQISERIMQAGYDFGDKHGTAMTNTVISALGGAGMDDLRNS